jgi:hypothetical protein
MSGTDSGITPPAEQYTRMPDSDAPGGLPFAGLSYATTNLGDEIQSIAADRFAREIKRRFDRDHLRMAQSDQPYLVIMNGWYADVPEGCFPPAPCIVPIITGFHIAAEAREYLLSPGCIAYFKQHEPVGCRDRQTMQWLQDAGVQTYYSKCLTLTLPARSRTPDDGRVFIVDLPRGVIDCVPDYLKKDAVWRTHKDERHSHGKFAAAQALLDDYRDHARLVITGRLHCALPCLAMGIPVVFFGKPDDYRIALATDCGLRIHPPRLLTWKWQWRGDGISGRIRRRLITADMYLTSLWYKTFRNMTWQPQTPDMDHIKAQIVANTQRHILRVQEALSGGTR